MKTTLNAIKLAKKKENYDEIKNLQIELVKINYANKPIKKKSALKDLNKIQVREKNLHEIKEEILIDYTGVFKMVGNLKVGDQIRQTHIRFKFIIDYEAYINAIDQDYDAEDAIFNGYIYKIDTRQFNLVNRSEYGNGCDFKHEIIEYRGDICFIPTKGYCFVKCINFLTGEEYKQQKFRFIRNEKRRSNIMTMARIQPCLKTLGIDHLGYFNGDRVNPRTVMNRDNASYFITIIFVQYGNHKVLVLIKLFKN